jgi:hypothetical protein
MFVSKSFRKIALLWVTLTISILSVPKVYVHEWLGHHHEVATLSSDAVNVSTHTNPDCRFEEFSAPVHFDCISPSVAPSTSVQFVCNLSLPISNFTPSKTLPQSISPRGPPAV